MANELPLIATGLTLNPASSKLVSIYVIESILINVLNEGKSYTLLYQGHLPADRQNTKPPGAITR